MNQARKYPLKLVLKIPGKRLQTVPLQLDFDNLFRGRLKTAVELMKLQKAGDITDNDWEIYVQIKSKL